MMYDWNHGSNWGAWIAMGFMMILLWGVIAGLVVYLVRGGGHRPELRPGTSAGPEDSALRILHERFAKGEIDAEEYTKRRDLLRPS